MKRVSKAILIIALFLVAGFAIGYGFGKLFGGGAVEHVQTDGGAEWKRITLIVISSFLGVLVGGFLQLIIHEAGHLVCGLISGYKFVSFRVLNFTLLKEDNKYKVKEFSVIGTAGQCLLSPPDKPVDEVPVVFYLLGGLLFNLLLTAVCFAIAIYVTDNTYIRLMFCTMASIGMVLIFTNGIPMTIGGTPNDGYNVLHLKGDLKEKYAMLNILRGNALVQGGTLPADLPHEIFAQLSDANLSKCLEANLAVLYISVLLQNGKIQEAESLCRRIIEESKVGMLKTEAKVELACILLNEGKTEEAMGLIDKNDMKLIEMAAKTQSSKQRVLFLRALKAENDRPKAVEIFEQVQSAKDKYLMKGEVALDLKLMWNTLKE